MDIQRVRFLREIVVPDGKDKTRIEMEFSYDERRHTKPHFFGVPADELVHARQLYLEWGGQRNEGDRRGSTAQSP